MYAEALDFPNREQGGLSSSAAGLELLYACKGNTCCTRHAKLSEGNVKMDKKLHAGDGGNRASLHPCLPIGPDVG